MTGSEPIEPTPPNAWFNPEHDFDSSQPAEVGVAEVRFDPSDPNALPRLLQALRKL